MIRKTFVNTDGKQVVVKHGCQTARFSVDEALSVKAEIEKAVEEAKNYKPGLYDLIMEFKRAYKKVNYFPMKRKITNERKELEVAEWILNHKKSLSDFLNILNEVILSEKDARFQKYFHKLQEDKTKESKKIISDIEFAFSYIKDRQPDFIKPFKIPNDLPLSSSNLNQLNNQMVKLFEKYYHLVPTTRPRIKESDDLRFYEIWLGLDEEFDDEADFE